MSLWPHGYGMLPPSKKKKTHGKELHKENKNDEIIFLIPMRVPLTTKNCFSLNIRQNIKIQWNSSENFDFVIFFSCFFQYFFSVLFLLLIRYRWMKKKMRISTDEINAKIKLPHDVSNFMTELFWVSSMFGLWIHFTATITHK